MNPTRTTGRTPAGANPSVLEIQRLVGAQLALPSRLGYTALLLAGIGAAAVAGALLATEAALPTRTRVAFALIAAIGLSWAVFAGWVLARRRVLYARHHTVAARMAVGFSAMFTLGAWAVTRTLPAERASILPVGVGCVMLGTAAVMLVRARRRVAELSRRRAELERRLGVGAPPS